MKKGYQARFTTKYNDGRKNDGQGGWDSRQIFFTKEECNKYIESYIVNKPHIIKSELIEVDIEDKYIFEGYFINDAAIEWGGITLSQLNDDGSRIYPNEKELDFDEFSTMYPNRKTKITIEFLE